jgi:hypothetical protein
VKIKFPKPKVAEYNGLFKLVTNNDKLVVQRSSKNADSSPINTWQNAHQVKLRGGASREENLLVSGRLAHPAPIVDSHSVVQAIRRGSRNTLDVDTHLLGQLLAAAEYARGAKVSDTHYSNPDISQSATSIIEESKPEFIRTSEKIAENVTLRLLNAPLKWEGVEGGRFDTSGITAITDEETLDENLKSFYERFLVQVMPLVAMNREDIKEPPPPPPPPTDEDEEESDGELVPVDSDKEPDPDAEEIDVPPPPPTKVESFIDQVANQIADNATENFEKFQEEQLEGDSIGAVEQEISEGAMEEVNAIGVPDVIQQEWERNLNWVTPRFALSSISPIQDDGQNIRSFTGIPTSDIWKISMLGNVNVMDSTSTSGDAANLLVLADVSGSTRDKVVTTKFGKGCTQDVIWALAGKLLELSVNSRSYGFYSSYQHGGNGSGLAIIEGQKAGLAPPSTVGGGGTPTAEVLAWAADKSESTDDVIVLITDGMPDHKAPAMVKRMTDNGSRVAVVVVPNTHDSNNLSWSHKVAKQFGGEMSAVCDVRDPRSIDALNEFMANLIV